MKITILAILLFTSGNVISQTATPAALPDTEESWRVLVKEKRVNQPAKETGEWKFMDQPFPPIDSVLSQQPDSVPLYGCYSWGGEYKQLRKEIQAVGWTTYRFGGFPDEEALIMAMEDGIEIMCTLQIGTTLEELKKSGKRDYFKSDEEFIQKYLSVLDEFCRKYGPGGSLFSTRPELAKHAVRHIEIWNEPNFKYMIPDEPDMKKVQAERDHLYARLLKASYAFVKERYPEVLIVGFAAGGSAKDDIRFIANVHQIDPKIGESYDILSTHPYTHTPPMANRVKSWGSYSVADSWKAIQEILDKYGYPNKPIWYTEEGWPILSRDGGFYPEVKKTDLMFTAMQQAACVTKMYVLASRLGVGRVHIMSATDTDSFNSGFFDRRTGEWRPSAHATRQMIHLLPKPRIQAVLSETTGEAYAYQFKSDWTRPDSPEVIVAWREVQKDELVIPVPAGKKVTKVLNMFGGEEPFSFEKASTVKFIGGPFPSYVMFE